MPKKIGVYFPDEDAEYYESSFKPAVEQAGDTVGGVFANAMREYVGKREKESVGLEPIELFIGEKDPTLGEVGEYISFIGKLVGKDQRKDGENKVYGQALYQTRKKKLLLLHEDIEMGHLDASYQIFDSMRGLKNVSLLPNVSKALKDAKISVRKIDV